MKAVAILIVSVIALAFVAFTVLLLLGLFVDSRATRNTDDHDTN